MDDRRRPITSRGRTLTAVLGLAFAAYGVAALLSIPRGPREFHYQNPPGGTGLWPPPFAPFNGFTPEQLSSHVARALFLFPASVLIGYAIRSRSGRSVPRLPVTIIAVATAASVALVAMVVTRGVPLQDDESTYLMQAELLTRGHVVDPGYPPSAAFGEPFTIFTPAGMSGMYLFGTPLVLALGLRFEAPWLGQAVLAGLTVWMAFRAAARRGHTRVAALFAVLLAASPMLLFTSAGALSQPATLAGVTLAVLGLAIGRWRGGILIGTGLGFAFAARPQSAVPAGMALLALYGWRDRRLLVATILAGLPWLAAVGVYDYLVVGTPWSLPRFAYTGEMEAYGFGTLIRHYEHTPLKAIVLAGVTLVRLNGWALGWPLSLAGVALWLALRAPHRAIVGPWAAVAVATFVYQAGYALIGTSETGAIYHYLALPFFACATAAAIDAAASRPWGDWIRGVALASFVIGTITFDVEHGWRLSRLATAIEGPRRSLPIQTPAVMLEETWGELRPQVGWVFGIPFRERSPAAPIVRYPRPERNAALQYLLERWKDRQCGYLWYEWRASSYRLSPCDEIGAHDDETLTAVGASPADLPVDDRPWFAEGAWRAAFPYLWWARTSRESRD